MGDLAEAAKRAKALEVERLADAIQELGFACTDCGECCTVNGPDDPHTATVSPSEARRLQERTAEPWEDVVRPTPFGLDADGEGQTFEWALQTDGCGDCRFYDGSGSGGCTVYHDRPGICRTYPFQLDLAGTMAPDGPAVDRAGPVVAYECEGLGTPIEREDALALARSLKWRTIREIAQARSVKSQYAHVADGPSTVVYDSEGAKTRDGRLIDQ